MHWSDAYLGRPYLEGEFDCAALAGAVAREVLGLAVTLPGERLAGLRGMSAQVAAHKEALAARAGEPADGQPLLMIARGRLNHIGVACWLAGEWWVLHADRGAGMVVRQRLRELERLGYTIEGYYRWRE
ncbi:hypothetical protein EBB06_12555 [Crenobacter cavernae]|uniref:Peptidoglycan endopeptidase n=1 Tax=Crenobacter cavernae TaxID=2290923 RepID=A0ABY0FEN4_9NEIS|nr:hypothetical protein EBB06_12555 [Crenobacter cavernae]